MAQLTPLAGERHPDERNRSVQACNDYLRMGPGRSLAKLHQFYIEIASPNQPTRTLRTLAEWSSRYGWQTRAEAYDAEIEREKNEQAAEHRRQIMEEGFALDHERARALKKLATLLEGEIYDEAKRWLPDVKQIGGGEFAEKVEITRFNSALIEQFRGVLDDIAKETGGRRQRQDHLVKSIDLSKLTDEQLERLAAGEDPVQVILSGYIVRNAGEG